MMVKVLEVVSGFGLGGAERAIAARLARTSSTIETVIVNIGVRQGSLRDDIAASTRIIDSKSIALRRLTRIIRSERPMLVVSHTPRAAILVALATAILRSRPVLVTVAHQPIISDKRWKNLLQAIPLWWANRCNDLTIAVSEPVLHGQWTRGSRRVVVVPLGAELVGTSDDLSLTEYWSEQSRLRWLVLSRLIPAKNLDALIAAVATVAPLMRSAGAELSVVGDGPSTASIDVKIAAHGVSDLVNRRSATLYPGALMREADALVVTSFSEGGPLTVFEALIAGTRVLSTPVGVVPHLRRTIDDDGLIVLADHSPGSIAVGLECLLARGPCGEVERGERQERFAHLHVDQTTANFVNQLRLLVP